MPNKIKKVKKNTKVPKTFADMYYVSKEIFNLKKANSVKAGGAKPRG